MEPTQKQLSNRMMAVGDKALQTIADANPQQFDGMADAAGWTSQPMVPNTINANILKTSTSPVKLPPMPTPSPVAFDPKTIMQTAQTIAQQFAPNQGEQQIAAIEDSISQLTGDTALKEQRRQQLYNAGGATGVTGISANLDDLIGQLNALQATEANIPDEMQAGAAGRGITAGGLAPLQTAAIRTNKIQQMRISANIMALTGRLAAAKKLVDASIDAEFAPKEAELQRLKDQRQYKLDAINRGEARMTKATELAIQKTNTEIAQREREIQYGREDRKIIQGWAVEAMKNEAPSYIVAQAQDATTPEQALTILGSYLVNPIEKEKALADLALTRQSIKTERMQQGKLAKEIAGDTPENRTLTAAQKTRQDSLNTVVSQLSNYRKLLDTTLGTSGVNLMGADAAKIRTAKASLEFAIAQAVGTGALQAADRAVVADIIGDPTSFFGASGIAARGGKAGVLASLDEAAAIFSSAKASLEQGGVVDVHSNNDPYAEQRAKVPQGQILISRNGQVGYISPEEFNPNTDKKL